MRLPNNPGCLQIGFVADDAEAIYEKLKSAGVEMRSPSPAVGPSGPIAGSKISFCKAPDGMGRCNSSPSKSSGRLRRKNGGSSYAWRIHLSGSR